MSRTATVGLVAFLGLFGSMARTATAQAVDRMPQNRTLDAQFPSAHAYIIEVWFSPQNKPATFKARVFDPSIPGDYDRQAWEAYRTKMNAPGSGWVSRRVDFTSGQGNRPTEREQIMERVKHERDRLEFQDLKTVDVKPHPSEQPKSKAETKGFVYNSNARKQAGSLAGTTWKGSTPYQKTITFNENGFLTSNSNLKDKESWRQEGNKVYTKFLGYTTPDGVYHSEPSEEEVSTIDGDTLRGGYEGWTRVK